MTEWQPIETAPRDGVRILIYIASENSYIDTGVFTAYWDGKNWMTHEDGGDYYHDETCPEEYVTHWMPLPKPLIK